MHCAPQLCRFTIIALLVTACRPDSPIAPGEASFARTGSTLTAPSEVTATPVGASRIAVTWQDNTISETGFEIHRSTTGEEGSYTLLLSTSAAAQFYEDASVEMHTAYCYKVRALGLSHKRVVMSAFSNAACAVISSESVTVTAVTTGAAVDVDGYLVTLSRPDVGTIATSPVAANGTVTFPDLAPETYSLRLEGDAPNCQVIGAWSPTVTIPGATAVRFDIVCDGNVALAYAKRVDGNAEIYTLGPVDWQNPVRLTVHPARDVEPAWSPDGSRIAFVSDRDGNDEIYVMNADGSNPVRLTTGPSSDFGPAWSPDGARIAFATDRDGNAEIYLMNADGTGLTRVTNDPEEDIEPDWSPDGRSIAFTRGWPGHEHVYTMGLDGTAISGIGEGSGPAWSPDGSQLAMSYRLCSEDLENNWCWRAIVLTSDWRFLTFSSTQWIDPAWSPGGKKLAYVEGTTDFIVVTHVDRYQTLWLTHGFQPAWRR